MHSRASKIVALALSKTKTENECLERKRRETSFALSPFLAELPVMSKVECWLNGCETAGQ